MKILIEISARHVHFSKQDFILLFGTSAFLNKKKDLSQPGQFACFEKVNIIGPKACINGVSILGPFREETQVEISLTDARKIGVNNLPIRESGFLQGTPGCEISGPLGIIKIKRGLIAAKRHIHLTHEIAEKNGLKNGQTVEVKISSKERPLIFSNITVRVSKNFSPAMHIDTDEANAAGIQDISEGKILL